MSLCVNSTEFHARYKSKYILPCYNQDFLYQFISEEQSDFEEKTEEDKVKDFLEENDIMTAKDPFSEFLRGQM